MIHTFKTVTLKENLPYLKNGGIEFKVLEDMGKNAYIELEVTAFTLIAIFYAGASKGIDTVYDNRKKMRAENV